MNIKRSRELFLIIRQLVRKNASLISRETAALDLTPEQWLVLRVINSRKSLTQKAVSEMSCKDTSTVTRVLDQLEKKGLITRSPHPVDRRAIALNSTPQGHCVAEEAIQIEKRVHGEIMSGVSETELDSITETFTKILKNMETLEEKNQKNGV